MPQLIRKITELYEEAFGGLPRETWLLAIVLLINRSGTMVLPFLAIYAKKELGFSSASAAMLLGVYGIGSLAGNYLGGHLTNWLGAIRTQALSILLSGFWFLLLSVISSQVVFVLMLFVLSICAETFRPANATAIADFSSPEQRSRAMGLSRMAMHLGYSVGPVVGGLLASFHFVLLFWIDGLTCLLSAAVLLHLFPARTRNQNMQSCEGSAGIRSPWRDAVFLVFVTLTFATSLVAFQLMATFPLYLVECYGFEEWHVGLLLAVKTVSIVVFEMVLLKAIESWNLLRTIAVGAFLTCLGFGLLPFGIHIGFSFALACVLIWTVGEMVSMPLSFTWIANRIDAANRGVYMGAMGMSYSAAFIVGPLIGGELYSITPDLVWNCSLMIAVVVLTGFLTLSWYSSQH